VSPKKRSRTKGPAKKADSPRASSLQEKPTAPIAAAPQYLIFDNLDEPAKIAAGWVADYFVRENRWPNLVQFVRFCYGAEISIDQLRNDLGHDVFEGSISPTNPTETELVRVRPWVLYDLGIALNAFDVAFETFLGLIDKLARGPETILKIDEQIIDPAVPKPVRSLVGRILVDRYGGSPPDADGKWLVNVEMHDVKVPLPDLAHFVSRPQRRAWSYETMAVSTLIPNSPGQKPAPWAFISSTLDDLREHRQAALEAALRLKILPLGMELWTASAQPPLRECLDALAEANLMILIIGCRYGSLTDDGVKSYTEAEYDHARKLNIPVYAFLPSRQHQWAASVLERQYIRRLEKFVERIRKETTFAEFINVDDLRSKIIQAMSKVRTGSDDAVLQRVL
jgi:hypothetical protein